MANPIKCKCGDTKKCRTCWMREYMQKYRDRKRAEKKEKVGPR